MIDPADYLKAGQMFHGHKCPAMPLGLRIGAAAMNALDVERSHDGQLVALVEIGERHFATCFADGVQMVTGCTFGKGNIKRMDYGKWGLTLFDVASGRSVRVALKGELLKANTKTAFFTEYRSKGVPASKVPAEVVDPLVERAMTIPDETVMTIGDVVERPWHEPPHSFNSFICDECGDIVVEEYGRVAGDRRVCIPCHEALSRVPEPRRCGCVEC